MLLIRRINEVGLAILSAILLMLSFPNFDFSFLAWIAFVPLFFAVKNKSKPYAFLLGYITGLIFFLGSMYWLIHVTLLGYIPLSLYLALYFGFFALLLSYTLYTIHYTLLLAPAIWVSLEYLRATILTGMGWSLLAYSQYKNLPVIQIADITGPYGISFLIVMVNIAIYQLILAIGKRADKKHKLYAIRYTLYAITLVLLVLCYGYFKLNQHQDGEAIKISVIQGNIPQHQKWDEGYRGFIFDRYNILTKVASTDEPDLIIWPETAFPGYFRTDRELTEKMKKLTKEVQPPILFGTPVIQGQRYINAAVLLDSTGKEITRYGKLRLVPFGEYVPFEKWLTFVHNLAPSPIGDFTAGNEYTVFNLSAIRYPLSAKFSVLICFEDIFPSLVRRFVREGALFLVNITNDAWFKESAAPYQHAQASVFRAVENRVNIIRSANTGLSCFINPKGRITSRVENKRGKDIFVEGYDTQTIKTWPQRALYTTYGDLFVYICMVILTFSLLCVKLKR